MTGDEASGEHTDGRSSTTGAEQLGWVDEAKKAFRGPASACLSLEIVIVPLSLLVMDKVEGGLTPLKIAWVLVLTLGMVVAIARFSTPWGLPLALALQVLMLLGWIVSPSLGALGVVFCLVWAGMLWMRHEVLRRRAQWAPREG